MMIRKNSLAIIILFTPLIANASLKYECNRYVNDKYQGYTYVTADNKAEAEEKALEKFKDKLDKKVDYVKCK